MSAPESSVGYLYVNGLGSGNVTLKDRAARWWWGKGGYTLSHAGINWYDGGTFEEKRQQVKDKVTEMLSHFAGVTIIGGSAGGSLALNTFAELRSHNVCAVSAHARVKVGNYKTDNRMSLDGRAKMGTDHASPAFRDSVHYVETVTIPSLSDDDKRRLLNLTQLTDLAVSPDLMGIEGVQTHRSIAFGHSGGYLAHLFADRDLITNFAERNLSHK
jgi:hypothetical protein